MKRFLATLERDLEQSLGVDIPRRTKIASRREEARTEQMARQVVEVLQTGGVSASVTDVPATSALPALSEPIDQR